MNERYLVDTCVISNPRHTRPDPGTSELLARHDGELATASVVWHELLCGVERLAPSRRKEALWHYLHDVVAETVVILPYDSVAAEWHARQRAELSRRGLTPSFPDGQIAAIAATRGLVLATRNVKHFECFAGLQVEQW